MTTLDDLVKQTTKEDFIPAQGLPATKSGQVADIEPSIPAEILGFTKADIDLLSATQNYSPWVTLEEISLNEDYSSSLVGLTTDGFTSLTNEDIPFDY